MRQRLSRVLSWKQTWIPCPSCWIRTNQRATTWRLLSVFVVTLVNTTALAAAPAHVLPLETFEESPLFSFPPQWQVRGNTVAAHTIYRVMAERNNQFLHADANQQAIQIGLVRRFSPQDFPVVRWRWRVLQLPSNGDESRKETHDSAAGVYILFDNTLFPRIIKYVWSTTLPVGARVSNPLYWRAKIIVLATGAAGLGTWRQETVNVYADYKALFGAEPGEVQGIGVASSSSFTKSRVIADYDDFQLLNLEAWRMEQPAESVLPQQSKPIDEQHESVQWWCDRNEKSWVSQRTEAGKFSFSLR